MSEYAVTPADVSLTELHESLPPAPKRLGWLMLVLLTTLALLVVGLGLVLWLLTPPSYVGERTITVTPGSSVAEVVAEAAAEGIVRSELLLYLMTLLRYPDETIETGTYIFTSDQNTLSVATELMLVTPPDELIRLTFPEGITRVEMARIAAETVIDFDTEAYLALTIDAEGLLWPETYFIPSTYSAAELVALQRQELETVLEDNATAVAVHPLTEYEILILASIVEREANDPESMALVAGILLNRLDAGMYLQADATIEYVLDTPLGQLPPGQLAENLREIESPYNTYKNFGLPPTPIGNPGIDALTAVLNPTPSDYYFYITGNDGNFYYAETYDQHLANIARYLR
jgi:UPF0755 protein